MTINAEAGPSRMRAAPTGGRGEDDPYVVPELVRNKGKGTGKLRLKQTPAERARMLRRREASRLADRDARIARANNALPSSKANNRNSTAPSRAEVYGYDPTRIQVDEIGSSRDDGGAGGGDWELGSDGEADFVVLGSVRAPMMGSTRAGKTPGKASEPSGHAGVSDHTIERNKARSPNASHCNHHTDIPETDTAPIPRRHRPTPPHPQPIDIDIDSTPSPHTPSTLPPHVLDPHGRLNDDAYLSYIRSAHHRTQLQRDREIRRIQELESSRRRAERERAAEAALYHAKKEEKRRRRVEKERKAAQARLKAEEEAREAREKGEKVGRWKEGVRARYVAKWAEVYGSNAAGQGAQGEWSFAQVPWPIYPPRTADGTSTRPITLDLLTKSAIKAFLLDMPTLQSGTATEAKAGETDSVSMRKILGRALHQMHPDRATTRLLPRVREADRQAVREGVEVCARILNALKDAE